jgi:DNA-damage-inducible protein D
MPAKQVLDHMGSTELAANLFRATQTEEKLRRENVRNKDHANRIHNDVGRKVRRTIHELGGTMPENLPSQVSSQVSVLTFLKFCVLLSAK